MAVQKHHQQEEERDVFERPRESRSGRILITRPESDSKPYEEIVSNQGFKSCIEPMLLIETLQPVLVDSSAYDALIFTSARGVEAFMYLYNEQQKSMEGSSGNIFQKPVYAVGKNTAYVASQCGFESVVSADGDVFSLAAMVQERALFSQRFLYPRGQNIRHEVAKILADEGYQVEDVVVYAAHQAETLSKNTVDLLENKSIGAALFFSVRSAEAWVRLIEKYGMQDAMQSIKALCLSESVLKSLSVLPWQHMAVSDHPDRDGMIRLLDSQVFDDKPERFVTEANTQTKVPIARPERLQSAIQQGVLGELKNNKSNKTYISDRKEQRMRSSTRGKVIPNAEEIIQRFGGIRPMASKMNVPVTTVQGWKKRNAIPSNRRSEIEDAAQANDIDIADLLARHSGGIANQNENMQSAQDNRTSTASEEAEPDITFTEVAPDPGTTKEQSQKAATQTDPLILDAELEASNAKNKATQQNQDHKGRITMAEHKELMNRIHASERKAFWQSITGTFVLIAVVAGVFGFLLLPSAQQVQQHEQQIGAIEGNVKGLSKDMSDIGEEVRDLNMRSDFLKGVIPGDVQEKYNQLQKQAGNLQNSFTQLKTQSEELKQEVLGADAGTISDRLQYVESQLQNIEGTESFTAVINRIQAVESSLGKAVGGEERLASMVSELTSAVNKSDGRMDMLEEELAFVQHQDSALGQTLTGVNNDDLRAAAMLVAFAQLRNTLGREDNFEQDLALLQKMTANDDPELQTALAKLAPHASEGVLTPEGLSTEFKGLAGDIVVASLQGEDVSFKEKAQARFSKLFKVEKDGELLNGTGTQSQIARAQNHLDQGNVAAAIAELESLEGPAAQEAAPFLERARATDLAKNVEALVGKSILSQISSIGIGGGLGAGAINLGDPNIGQSGAAASQQGGIAVPEGLSDMVPGLSAPKQEVVRDEESGTVILPQPGAFKGFSSGQ